MIAGFPQHSPKAAPKSSEMRGQKLEEASWLWNITEDHAGRVHEDINLHKNQDHFQNPHLDGNFTPEGDTRNNINQTDGTVQHFVYPTTRPACPEEQQDS